MPWADDLLKNLTPEQKRQLVYGLTRVGAWMGNLGRQIASQGQGRVPEVPQEQPSRSEPDLAYMGSGAREADIQAVLRSGLPGRHAVASLVVRAYAGGALSTDEWSSIAHAVRIGNSVPIHATSDNPPYVTFGSTDKPTNGIHKTDVETSPGVQEGPRMRRMAMSREEYDRVHAVDNHPGLRARMMAERLGLQSDAIATHYDDANGTAYIIHSSFEPVETGARTPMMERRTLASDHAM